MTTSEAPIRIGVLGAANIARLFIAGVAPSKKVEVVAIGSRDAGKGAAFAKEVGVGRSHGSYEALFADPEVDVIYLPLPNALHAEWAVKALEAGKHVLCEKPIATSEADTREMFAAARSNGRILAEAYPYMSQPQTVRLRELHKAGTFGRLRLIQSTFGFTISDRKNVRFDPGLGGGALLDAGSYAVSFVRILAGTRPERVFAKSHMDGGIDLTTSATLDFADGLVAQVNCSFEMASHRHGLVIGDDGAARTTYLNHLPVGGPPIIEVKRGWVSPNFANPVGFETEEVEAGNGFLYEAESFASLVRGKPAGWTGATEAESVDIMAILDAIRDSAAAGRPVDLKPA